MTMSPPTHPSDPRGITMVIVLVAMATATILATAYLASRDNSTLIGRNAMQTTSARTGSLNGLEVAAAIFETESDWRTTHDDGLLVDGLAIGEAMIGVTVVDLLTEAAPTEGTEYVRITSTSVVGGIMQEATATAFVPLPGSDEMIDLDLGEFSISAVEGLTMRDRSMVARWPASPKSRVKEQVKIFTGTTVAGAVDLGIDTATLDTMIFTPPGASASLVNGTGLAEPRVRPLSDTIPMPAPALPPTDPAVLDLGDVYINFPLNFSTFVDAQFGDLTTGPGGVIQVAGPEITTVNRDFVMGGYSRMLVAAPMELLVLGDLELQPNSAIELLTDTATLDIWVAGNVLIDSAHVGHGVLADLGTREAHGAASYFDPSRIRIRSMPGEGIADPSWQITGDSVVKAMIDAPDALPLGVRDTAVLYGNARARTMEMAGDAMVMYDPALDKRLGYTSNPRLWDGGAIIPSAKAMTTLSADEMKLVAEANETDVMDARDAAINSDSRDAKEAAEVPPVMGPTDPTPRPVPIQWNVDRTGTEQAESVRR